MITDEQQIRDLVSAWQEASKAGDTETVLRLMTDDVMFLTPGNKPMSKEAFKAASEKMSRSSVKFDGTSEILEINICGDWAYVITSLRVTITPASATKPAVRSGHTLSIMRKQNGTWLLARDANMLAPTPE